MHGQFDQRGLLNPQAHRGILDAFGGLEPLARRDAAPATAAGARPRAGWPSGRRRWRRPGARRTICAIARELADLAPQPGEEEELAARRQQLQQRDRLATVLGEALAASSAPAGRSSAWARRAQASSAGRHVARAARPGRGRPGPRLGRGGRGRGAGRGGAADLGDGTATLEEVEERLFSLRDAARKHRVAVEGLPDLLAETLGLIERIDAGAGGIEAASTRPRPRCAPTTARRPPPSRRAVPLPPSAWRPP
ncbi:MAG: hypothetical protein U1E17_03005 [Geminicoccaceae bacterium]